MTSFYTSTTILTGMALAALSLLVHENARIPGRDKRLLYLTYLLIGLAALAEYLGARLSGQEYATRGAVLFVKTLDYILTPMAGGAILLQLRLKNRWNWIMGGLIAVNTLVQLLNPLTFWTLYVDKDSVYHHGPLYPLYMGVCMAVICIVILQFFLYGRSFRRQNRKSLYAILLLVLVAIALQEIADGDVRTSYLGLTMAASLIFIHYAEFGAQEMDDSLQEQRLQLDTDALTGVYSRFAYGRALNELAGKGPLPEEFAAFTVDINGLKRVNDRLGHEAGDELIRGAAECILGSLCQNGRCYRTGGDEFVVLALMGREQAVSAVERLNRDAARWSGKSVRTLSVSAGFALAAENPGLSAEKLVGEADKAMYEAKAAYYRQSGIDRRRR